MKYYIVNQKQTTTFEEEGNILADVDVSYRLLHNFMDGTLAIETDDVPSSFIKELPPTNKLVTSHLKWFDKVPDDVPELQEATDGQ